MKLDKSKTNLNTIRDKVRSKLYNYESKYIDTLTKLLRKDIIQLELSSKRLIKEANQIKKKKEQQQSGRMDSKSTLSCALRMVDGALVGDRVHLNALWEGQQCEEANYAQH